MADKEIINIDHDSLKAAESLLAGESLKIGRDENGRIIQIEKEAKQADNDVVFNALLFVLFLCSLLGIYQILEWLFLWFFQ